MSVQLSICIPCYNKSKHICDVISALDPLHDIAEVCIFDNGSTDNLENIVKEITSRIKITYQKAYPRGPIDHGWLGAIGMSNSPYTKLQLGDDVPDANNIRNGLNQLRQNEEAGYVISKCSVMHEESLTINPDSELQYFITANSLRKKIKQLETPKDRAEFLFNHYAFNNTLGDINGLIFRSECINGISAMSQTYYGFHTHPDSEIFMHLIANHHGIYHEEPFSTYYSNKESPTNICKSDKNFSLKVYKLPNNIHTLLLFFDPSMSKTRKLIRRRLLWKTYILYIINLFQEIKSAR
jgi:glycosyltransferase involved in cell wall biosynthesis